MFRAVGRRVFWWCAVAPAIALVWCSTHAGQVLDGRPVVGTVEWVPKLGLDFSFRLDAFAYLMVVLVSGIGVLIFLYAGAYFAGHETPKLGTFAAELTVFAGAMLGLVLADNLFALFVFWELTSITSYLLIGYDDAKGSTRAAARQALLVTGGGGLALLAGFVLLSQAAGTASLSEILAAPPSGPEVTAALVLVLLGVATKSAQVPFHFWLPSAMTAPTPVSAYLHSATMVKAGIYLLARFAPAFESNGVWKPLVITMGLTTMLVGGYRALRQYDLKLLLAYGTISQLGFLVVLFGTGEPDAVEAGAALLLAHGIFKAALFMAVGVIDHQAHTRDVRLLDGLGRRLPVLAGAATLAAVSMAGIPPLLGFIAKELAYESFLDGALGDAGAVVLATIVAGSVLTFAYAWRFLWGAFGRKEPSAGADLVGSEVARPTVAFVWPITVLAIASLVLGVVPALATPLVVDGARALDAAVAATDLSLFHGFNAALALSALTWALGVLLIARRRAFERLQESVATPPSADDAYRGAIDWLNRIADRVTGVLQNGSLPVYLMVVLSTVLLLPGVALAIGAPWPDAITFADSPLQAAVVGLVVAASIATAVAHRRFVAVLLLGSVGFGTAALFVIQGGPDLAVTQLLVETLIVVVFVLVLRHLPEQFPRQAARTAHLPRILIAVGIGTFMTVFTLVAAGVRSVPSVSEEYAKRSLPEGGGRNIVNVVITDFRGLDTLGEIAVLTVATLGIASLVLAGRAARHATRDSRSADADAVPTSERTP